VRSARGTGRRPRNAAGPFARRGEEEVINSVIYLVGLVVVVIAILSFFGLR
jgi:hypothetical protein